MAGDNQAVKWRFEADSRAVNDSLDKMTAKIETLERQTKKAGTASKTASKDMSQGMSTAASVSAGLNNSLRSMAGNLAAMASGGAVLGFLKSFAEELDRLDKSALSFASTLNDIASFTGDEAMAGQLNEQFTNSRTAIFSPAQRAGNFGTARDILAQKSNGANLALQIEQYFADNFKTASPELAKPVVDLAANLVNQGVTSDPGAASEQAFSLLRGAGNRGGEIGGAALSFINAYSAEGGDPQEALALFLAGRQANVGAGLFGTGFGRAVQLSQQGKTLADGTVLGGDGDPIGLFNRSLRDKDVASQLFSTRNLSNAAIFREKVTEERLAAARDTVADPGNLMASSFSELTRNNPDSAAAIRENQAIALKARNEALAGNANNPADRAQQAASDVGALGALWQAATEYPDKFLNTMDSQLAFMLGQENMQKLDRFNDLTPTMNISPQGLQRSQRRFEERLLEQRDAAVQEIRITIQGEEGLAVESS